MSECLNEDNVVVGYPLSIKILFLFFELQLIISYLLHLYVGDAVYHPYFWFPFFLCPFILIFLFFAKIIINKNGIDILIGIVGRTMKYYGFLIDHFKWGELKVVLDHEYSIQFMNVKRTKWAGILLLFMVSPINRQLSNDEFKERITISFRKSNLFENQLKTKLGENNSVDLKKNKVIRISTRFTNYKRTIPIIAKYGRHNLSADELNIFDAELEKRYFIPHPPFFPKSFNIVILTLIIIWILYNVLLLTPLILK
jgi:hypothetical protein